MHHRVPSVHFFNLNLFILIGGKLLYNIVSVLPYINMNLPRVYTCSQSWTPINQLCFALISNLLKNSSTKKRSDKRISSWAFHWNCEYIHLTFRIVICVNFINHKNKIYYFNYLCLLLYFTIKFKIIFVMYWHAFPQNSYVEASAPKVTIFRDGPLRGN